MPAQPKSKSAMDANDETGRRVPPPATNPLSLAQCALRRQTPEVGAECPNRARSDLCGGRSAMGVPTANTSTMVGAGERSGVSDVPGPHCQPRQFRLHVCRRLAGRVRGAGVVHLRQIAAIAHPIRARPPALAVTRRPAASERKKPRRTNGAIETLYSRGERLSGTHASPVRLSRRSMSRNHGAAHLLSAPPRNPALNCA